MLYKLEFDSYRQSFNKPFSTNHGIWKVREGITIKLTDETGNIGYGEIAPIPWFGSESLREAREFCQNLDTVISDRTIYDVPDNLPACQFGFASAIEDLKNRPDIKLSNSQIAGLLPAGTSALSSWKNLYALGYRTFKWKISVTAIEEELAIFQKLTQAMPSEVKLRLDANTGLSYQEAIKWLEISEGTQVEYLEQPLPVSEFEAMQELIIKYNTAIALDESVATIAQLQQCYDRGWRGIFVIKPAIAGYPHKLRQFFKKHQIDAVFSSVFETAVGRQAALKLAIELSNPQRALGFGVGDWFES